MPWVAVFRWLEHVHALLDDPALADASPEFQAIEWRQRLDYAPLADVPALIAVAFPVEKRGVDALAAHQDRFRQLLARLASA